MYLLRDKEEASVNATMTPPLSLEVLNATPIRKLARRAIVCLALGYRRLPDFHIVALPSLQPG